LLKTRSAPIPERERCAFSQGVEIFLKLPALDTVLSGCLAAVSFIDAPDGREAAHDGAGWRNTSCFARILPNVSLRVVRSGSYCRNVPSFLGSRGETVCAAGTAGCKRTRRMASLCMLFVHVCQEPAGKCFTNDSKSRTPRDNLTKTLFNHIYLENKLNSLFHSEVN
jgi:hypothetical protein